MLLNFRLYVFVVAVVMLAVPQLASAQAAATASILGKVTDQSGGTLPGATITVTSPALQVGQIVVVTDETGGYQVRDLPAPGVYRVAFELQGFQTVIQEQLNLTTGFSARVDANLMVGELAETVTVVSETPTVDIIETARVQSISEVELRTIPRGGGFQEIFQMAPGLSTSSQKPDVGDSNLGTRSPISTYGALLNMAIKFEGIDITSESHDYSTVVYISSYNLAEVQFKSSGQAAEVSMPGFSMDSIMKSGSNQLRPWALLEYSAASFQSNNVTPELKAQGIQVTSPLKNYRTLAGDLGGKIVRDKLWFYGAASQQSTEFGRISVVSGPNAQGCWTCPDAPPAELRSSIEQYSAKFNYQPRNDLRLITSWTHSKKFISAFNPSLTQPLPSANAQSSPFTIYKGEVQWTLSPQMVVNALYGNGISEAIFQSNSPLVQGNPTSTEQTTGLQTGPSTNYTQRTPSFKKQLNGNLVWVTGEHQFKFGVDLDLDVSRDIQQVDRGGPGAYYLIFNRGLPFQIVTLNSPVLPKNRYNNQGVFAQDTWRLGNVTLNYGVRADRYHSYYPDQRKPAGPLSAAADFPGKEIMTWKDFLPRAGASWDIFGDGNTVLKGSFGIFGDTMGAGWASSFNPVGSVQTTYRWNGPCVTTPYNNVSFTLPNTSCDVDPATLATLNPTSPSYIPNNPNYVSATGSATLRMSDLDQPKIHNYTLRIERSLSTNMGVSAGYVRYRVNNGVFPASGAGRPVEFPNRPYSAYSVVVPFTDPMTGNAINIYSYPSSFVGPQFDIREFRNVPDDRPDVYNTFEVTMTKRYSNRWNAVTSFWTTKNNTWLTPLPTSPNNDRFVRDQTRSWEARLSGMLHAPWGFDLSGFYRATSGTKGQRTVRFTGPQLLQGAVTVPVEEYGAQQGPVIAVANLKVVRPIRFGGTRNVQLGVEVFNLLNNSSATAYSWLTGTTYGRVTGIVDPRVMRISAEVNF